MTLFGELAQKSTRVLGADEPLEAEAVHAR